MTDLLNTMTTVDTLIERLDDGDVENVGISSPYVDLGLRDGAALHRVADLLGAEPRLCGTTSLQVNGVWRGVRVTGVTLVAMRGHGMSALNITKSAPSHVTWNLGGVDFHCSRALVNAALIALDHDEVTVHGALALLSRDELRSLLADMDGAWEAHLDKQRERIADFESNWT